MIRSKETSSSDSLDLYAAKLAVVGAAVTVLGDGIVLLAANLALEALEQSNNGTSNNSTQSKDSKNTEQQIDYLISELKQIKKMMK